MEEQNNKSENANNDSSNQQNSDKTTKEYENNLKLLTAILGGEKNTYPIKKVKNNTIKSLVNDLLEERNKKVQEELKSGLINLLDKRVDMEKAFKAKEDELKKLKESKLKEFNEEFKKIIGKVDDMKQLTIDYENTIKEIK